MICYGYYPRDARRELSTRFDRRFIWFRDSYRRLSQEDFEQMYAGIIDKFADLLEKKNLNLAELTYQSFTRGRSAVEEARSVAILLTRWLG